MGLKRWTESEVNKLKELNSKDYTRADIAKRLGRNENSIKQKMSRLGIHSTKIAKAKGEPHKFDIGQEINGLKLIKQVRHGKKNSKAYVVQSLTYPDAPSYAITEYALINGVGCSYKSGRRIFEGNSLWAKKECREYLVNIEEAKKTSPYNDKPIVLKCPECGKKKMQRPKDLLKYGLRCPKCSKGTSYPELLFLSYLDVKGIEYDYQINDLLEGRVFDFRIYINDKTYLVETHGLGHYDANANSGNWDYEVTKNSDKEKRQYCKDNNINLIELDCRYSTYEHIENSINNTEELTPISKYERSRILEVMEKSKRYPVKEIIEFYNNGESTLEIGERYKISHVTVGNILKRNNVKLRVNLTSVKCLNTGEVFTSFVEASKWCGLKNAWSIGAVCRGERNYAGKHPITGEKLYWERLNLEGGENN